MIGRVVRPGERVSNTDVSDHICLHARSTGMENITVSIKCRS